MKMLIGIYDFEYYSSGNIHVYETRDKRRYFDMIRVERSLEEYDFWKKCKIWYQNNVLIT